MTAILVMRAFLVVLIAVASLSFLGVACAQTSADQAISDATDGVGQVVGGVTGGVPTDALPSIPSKGPDLGGALSAVGQFFAQVAGAIGDGVVAGVSAISSTALAASEAVATAVMATTDALVSSSQLVGAAASVALSASGNGLAVAATAIGDAALTVADSIGSAGAFVGAQFAFLGGLYADLVGGLRPSKMPEPVFAGIVATGAAASATAAGVGIFEFVRRFGALAGLPAVGGFSRIEDDKLLNHPLRAQVFQVIQANPGIHASELARRIAVGWGTIVHHLDKLEKGELVAIRKVNNQKCFFELGGKVSRVDMAIAGAVRGDSANQIASFVQAHPMTSQKAMASELGISPALASFHVKKLVGLGVLEKARRGKQTLLTTTESLRRVLAGESGAVSRPPVLMAPMMTV